MPRIFEYSVLDDFQYWLALYKHCVAESADHLAHSFDVTLCKHCVLQKGPRKCGRIDVRVTCFLPFSVLLACLFWYLMGAALVDGFLDCWFCHDMLKRLSIVCILPSSQLRSCRSTSTRPIYHCSPHQNVHCRVLRWPLHTAQLQVCANVHTYLQLRHGGERFTSL